MKTTNLNVLREESFGLKCAEAFLTHFPFVTSSKTLEWKSSSFQNCNLYAQCFFLTSTVVCGCSSQFLGNQLTLFHQKMSLMLHMLNSANCTFCDNVGCCEIFPRLYPTTFLHGACLFLICQMHLLSHGSEITYVDMQLFYRVHASLWLSLFVFTSVFWVYSRTLHLACALSYLNQLLCN